MSTKVLFLRQSESEVTEMKKRILTGIISLAVSLMFVSAVMAQEKAVTTTAAPAQVKAAASMAASTQEKTVKETAGSAQEKAVTSMAASAQEKAAKPMAALAQAMKLEKFNGVVENVDMAKKDVVVQYHKDKMSFSVGDKTKLFEGRKELKLSDLNKGLWASVEFRKEGNQLLAQSIHVSPVKQAKNTASSKGMTEKKMMPSEKTAQNKMMSTEKTTENK
jgi:hypothetical protein